jgi:hypothetical protein
MSIITLEIDNTLEKSSIVVPLMSSSQKEGGENFNDTNMTDKAQTSVMGIQMPLIMINTTVINFDAVQYFSLKSVGRVPELVLTVEDRFELISNIDKPGNDNEVRIQILPKFDNAYKKIDLTFFIDSIQVTGTLIQLTCSYKVPAFTSSQYKTFGEIDTYSLFKQVATETKLGFATNIVEQTDVRYSYCDNKSLLELLEDEIQFSNATDHILDWWVDLWDNINLADIKERYNAIDSDEDLKIWIAGQVNEVTVDNEAQPEHVTATLTDLPMYNNSELFVTSYTISNSPGSSVSKGSDKVYGIYEDINGEYSDYLIQDGDIKKDVFAKYEYIGENFGEYNYLLAKQLRDAYLQKINTESVVVTLKSPLLGLMRGHRVNYTRYVNNDMLENKIETLEDIGAVNRDIEANIPLEKYDSKNESGNGSFRLDKTASGQYLITGVEIAYTNEAWEYKLNLAKPASATTPILNNQE